MDWNSGWSPKHLSLGSFCEDQPHVYQRRWKKNHTGNHKNRDPCQSPWTDPWMRRTKESSHQRSYGKCHQHQSFHQQTGSVMTTPFGARETLGICMLLFVLFFVPEEWSRLSAEIRERNQTMEYWSPTQGTLLPTTTEYQDTTFLF